MALVARHCDSMKRYIFPLARVLRLRAAQETAARDELRRAAARARQAEERCEEEFRRYDAQIASGAALRGSLFNLLAFRDEAARRARAVLDAEAARAAEEQTRDEARAQWAEAKRRRSALERLDERRRAEHRYAADREEQSEIDDATAQRHHVKRKQPGASS